MSFFSSSLKRRILASIAIISLIITSVTLFLVKELSNGIDKYNALITESFSYERASAKLVVSFKIQVQEWKNVLLRGHNDANRQKYWQRFQQKQSAIQSESKALLNKIRQSSAASKLQRFIDSHAELMDKYQQGYDAFVEAGYDHKAGDKAVQGIDREPTKLIQEVADIIAGEAESRAVDTSESADSSVLYAMPVILGANIAFIYVIYLLLNVQFKRPIERVLRQVRRFGQGDFSHEVKYERKDEIGEISVQIASAQHYLREIMLQVKQASDHLRSNADTINTTSSDIAQSTESTNLRVESAATAVTELTSTAHEVAQSAMKAASAASDADSSAVSSRNTMHSTIDTIRALSGEVESAATVIEKLKDDTNSVGTVLDVIRGIAEQTNLLALNAAIEAARAGEQGRGFAVVADEVRSLAQRTQESTAEIQQIIENVQTGAKDAVAAMNKGQAATELCVDQANDAGNSIDLISGAVNDIHTQNTQIATAAEEQSRVSEDVSRNVNDISQATQNIVANVQQFNQLSSALVSMAEELNSATAKIRV
ncbi:MAG: methyl-accepting chemotaxis protein [Kangiellaceae bacterium]|jgi:methyl-accepting chemotaxis protein|nr:methyl-accepting chemotaxis protein [Kangiellaceae bacterium]